MKIARTPAKIQRQIFGLNVYFLEIYVKKWDIPMAPHIHTHTQQFHVYCLQVLSSLCIGIYIARVRKIVMDRSEK